MRYKNVNTKRDLRTTVGPQCDVTDSNFTFHKVQFTEGISLHRCGSAFSTYLLFIYFILFIFIYLFRS